MILRIGYGVNLCIVSRVSLKAKIRKKLSLLQILELYVSHSILDFILKEGKPQGWECCSVTESMLDMCKVLRSIPSTTHAQKEKPDCSEGVG